MMALIAPVATLTQCGQSTARLNGTGGVKSQYQRRPDMSESALRRRADRTGYGLRKSRSRAEYPTLDNYGEYMLVDVSNNISVIGHKFDASLSDVAEFLA